jgi:hypothetical protein
MTMETSGINLEEKWNMKEEHHMKVKQEPNIVILKEETSEVEASTA